MSEIYTAPLYTFLAERFGYRHGRLDIQALSQRLGVHPYTIYRWLHNGLPARGATTILRADRSIKRTDLLPFIVI